MTPELHAENNVSWGYQDLLLFTFLSMLSILGCQVLVGVLARALHLDSKNGAVILPSQLLLYACLMLVLFVLIKLQYGRGFWNSLAWKPGPVGLGAAFLLGLAFAFTIAVAALLLHLPDTDTPIKKLLSHRGTALQFAIVGITIGPLCEELVFRGFIQPVLVRSLGRALGILITACIFGALHLAQNSFLWQSGVLITAAGIAFGCMREFTGSTKASTWMHAGYNSTFFFTLFLNNQKLSQ